MSQATLRVQKISGHAGSVPGDDAQREFTVCKLIDTTTCIGCKACEVACMEWNDLPFAETAFDNTNQTIPDVWRRAQRMGRLFNTRTESWIFNRRTALAVGTA